PDAARSAALDVTAPREALPDERPLLRHGGDRRDERHVRQRDAVDDRRAGACRERRRAEVRARLPDLPGARDLTEPRRPARGGPPWGVPAMRGPGRPRPGARPRRGGARRCLRRPARPRLPPPAPLPVRGPPPLRPRLRPRLGDALDRARALLGSAVDPHAAG